ncbi:hypothetical protein N7492_009251 [Penicillium capsulatum]|uniref:Enoyl reductase (ER) domain-containing protein n=1 Tax=Penicillium capsulatum TaxID=69766 RepID=A0A9W9LHQ8_9EURO|nr:hypothetical protein N7492_009251 [Penicillium capsulatum]
MPSNFAAVLHDVGQPLQVEPAEYPSPEAHEILIKNHVIAVNPVDWQMQKKGTKMFAWMKFPHVLGSDVAGEVVEIGSQVTRFKVGDRVSGLAMGVPNRNGGKLSGGYQHYTLLNDYLTAHIPESKSYESMVVSPVGICTAACGLYQKDYLALQHPSVSPPAKPTGQTLLIWGGSSGVGSNAIQLAAASGYEVFTTASPKSRDYVQKLGAAQVFDYKSETVIQDIIAALKGKKICGRPCHRQGMSQIVGSEDVQGKKFVASAAPLDDAVLPEGVQSKFIYGNDLKDNEVGPMIWEEFYPAAIAQDKWVNVPEAEVFGKGLEFIQTALDIQNQGVPQKKVVVSLV